MESCQMNFQTDDDGRSEDDEADLALERSFQGGILNDQSITVLVVVFCGRLTVKGLFGSLILREQ